MSNIAPQHSRYRPPLTAGARFIRGFKRFGAVFGVCAFCAGIAISVVNGTQGHNSAVNLQAQAVCYLEAQHAGKTVINQYRAMEVDLAKSGCPGPMYSESVPTILEAAARRPAPLEGFIEPIYIGSLISLAVGIGVFSLFWLFGWLCAGFTRD